MEVCQVVIKSGSNKGKVCGEVFSHSKCVHKRQKKSSQKKEEPIPITVEQVNNINALLSDELPVIEETKKEEVIPVVQETKKVYTVTDDVDVPFEWNMEDVCKYRNEKCIRCKIIKCEDPKHKEYCQKLSEIIGSSLPEEEKVKLWDKFCIEFFGCLQVLERATTKKKEVIPECFNEERRINTEKDKMKEKFESSDFFKYELPFIHLLGVLKLKEYTRNKEDYIVTEIEENNKELLKYSLFQTKTKCSYDISCIVSALCKSGFDMTNKVNYDQELEDFGKNLNINDKYFHYNLKFKSIDQIIQECYKLNPVLTFRKKIDLNSSLLETRPWSLTSDDLMMVSNSYVFSGIDELSDVVLRFTARRVSNGSSSYVVKSRSYNENHYKIDDKKYIVLEPFIQLFEYSSKELEDFEIKYKPKKKKAKKNSKKQQEEEDEEDEEEINSITFNKLVKQLQFPEIVQKIDRNPKLFFDDYKVRGHLNLFTGFLQKRDKNITKDNYKEYESKIPNIIKHLKEVLCNFTEKNKNDKYYKFVIQWLANLFYGNKTNILLMFYSPEGGNGKTFFQNWLASNVIGTQSSLSCASQKDVAGHFNYHVAGKSLILIDELKNVTDDEKQQLKNITTANSSIFTKKGVDSVNLNNYSNIISNTNDAQKLLIFDCGDGNRRFYIIETNDSVRGNKKHFIDLDTEMKQQDSAHYFYNWICAQYDPDFKLDDPSNMKTEALAKIRQSACIVDNFLMRLKEETPSDIMVNYKYNENIYDKLFRGEVCKMRDNFVTANDIFGVFDLLNKNKFQINGFSQRISKYAFKYSQKEYDEMVKVDNYKFPTDKLIIKIEGKTGGKYKFNPDFV